MHPSTTASQLYSEFKDMKVIDAHEHLAPERVRTSQEMDVCDLFVHYTRTDFLCSGMSEDEWEAMHDKDRPLNKRWKILHKYLEHIRYGSYARPAFIYAKHLGFDDITEDNYQEISRRLQEENQPGIYRKVLGDLCNIKAALTQANRTDYDLDFMIPLMPLDNYARVTGWSDIEERSQELGGGSETLDDYLETTRRGLKRWIRNGAVGIKMVSMDYGRPERTNAVAIFDDLKRKPEKKLSEMNPLRDFLMDEMLEIACELDLVVAVHTGVWGDFRTLDPKFMINIVARHRQTTFDIYHMGMPWVREAGLIGKNNPNVYLNLCWSHIVSPEMTCSALDEYLDMVPVNKIIGFGGDYGKPVEKVYGHLRMAKENIARVLGRRIDAGLLSQDDALSIAEKWFYGNPKKVYDLSV